MNNVARVNLANGHITYETIDETICRKYIGGVGIGAHLLYGEVPPGIDWDSPRNRLIICSGPLNGTPLAGSGSFCVVTKGALTNGGASSQANGFFGAFMRLSGFETILIQGAAPDWVYIYIHDGVVELRDAGHLVGKDTLETEKLVKGELERKGRDLSVHSIGPAGENLARFACIVGDEGHVVAHNGAGAVMGSKRLKAVAAGRGGREIKIQDKARLSALNKRNL